MPALFLITAVCGLVDAACYLSLGQVFAEMMTGNLLLFCFYIGTGHPLLHHYAYLLALAVFGLGAVAGGRINRGPRGHTRFGFVIEGGFLLAALVAAIGLDTAGSEAARNFIVCLLSVAMGLQNGLLRRHGVPDLATNVMTLTMAALFADSTLSGGRNERWKRRLGSILVFMAGALVGAALTQFIGPWAPLSVAVALFALALLGLTYQHPGKE
jgi:uncharacterized membrane protein YoaK (UPF0700 family)